MPYETPTLRSQILDELSDGQWHPFYKINKKIERGSQKAKVFKETLNEELTKLVSEDVLIAGNNESYRFKSNQLASWRNISSSPNLEDAQYQPRYFGGILEDDGWLLAGLKTYDLIHFRADASLTREDLHKMVGGRLSLIQIEDGLYRVFSNNGEETFAKIQEIKELLPQYEIHGTRLEKDLRRRDLEDLPKKYVDDLCRYYGKFAKVLLRSYMSSITKHLPEQDDIQQQIYLWVLDAVQRYDAETSIPFAAYLGTSLKKWVFNLNRKAFGRAVADAELKHSRAIAEFKAEHGREPRQEELAVILKEDVSSTKKDSVAINTVFNLRNIATIHAEESEIPIASDLYVEDNIDNLVNNTLLSAAITTAAKQDMLKTKDITGLLGIYYENWGSDYKSKRVKMWTRSSKTQESIKRVMKIASKILDRDRGGK
jgi:DNA-directed RNA polymerase specialized sigma subunit